MRVCIYLVLFGLAGMCSSGAKAQIAKAKVRVSGMTCSMCQMATEKSLRTIDYIGEIKPDLSTNSFLLTFKKNKTIDLNLIKSKIKDAGFSVSSLVATFSFNKMPVRDKSVFTSDGSTYRFLNVSDRVLDGEVNLMLLSNGFVTNSDYKKYSVQNPDPVYKTGILGKVRVLHVTLVSN